MFTTTLQIPITTAEVEAARAQEIEMREAIARQNVRDANRKAGKDQPRVGDKLQVATARGIKTRGRAGLVFSQTPSTVTVIEATDEEVAAKQRAGASMVNVWGAEQILADSNGDNTGLVLFANAGDAAAASLNVDAMSDEEARAALEQKLAARKVKIRGAEEKIGTAKTDDKGATTKLGTGAGDTKKGDKA